MARVPTVKTQRQTSSRSRAARRANSPTKDVQMKDNTNTTNIAEKHQTSDVLAKRHGGGVTKKKKNKQKPTRQQRLRHEKGVARADAVHDQLIEKVQRSKKKGNVIKGRSIDWNELNERLPVGFVHLGSNAGGGAGAGAGGTKRNRRRTRRELRRLGLLGTNGDQVMVDEGGIERGEDNVVEQSLMDKVGELSVSSTGGGGGRGGGDD